MERPLVSACRTLPAGQKVEHALRHPHALLRIRDIVEDKEEHRSQSDARTEYDPFSSGSFHDESGGRMNVRKQRPSGNLHVQTQGKNGSHKEEIHQNKEEAGAN